MNKAKAYHRLKQKQKHSNSAACWIELAAARDSTPRLPLQAIKPLNRSTTSLEDLTHSPNLLNDKEKLNSTMYGLRRQNTYKHFSDDRGGYVTKGETNQAASSSLPFLLSSNNQQLTSIQDNRQSFLSNPSAKVNSTRRPVTSNPGTGDNSAAAVNTPANYTLLQAKLDALILPNPVKRKASRSFSGSSSGLHGRKLSVSGRDGIRPSVGQSADTENRSPRHSATSIQFPAASKMRQLLTKDQQQAEPQMISRELPLSRTMTTLRTSGRELRSREISSAAKFYFPSYTRQKQKTLKITTDPNTQVFKLASAMKPQRVLIESTIPKTVSFKDETSTKSTHRPPKTPTMILQPKQPSCEAPIPEPLTIQPAAGLALTMKNLEMYNTMTRTSELSIPSEEGNRVTSWVKERQVFVTVEKERCANIPEVEENVNSVIGEDNSSDSSAT